MSLIFYLGGVSLYFMKCTLRCLWPSMNDPSHWFLRQVTAVDPEILYGFSTVLIGHGRGGITKYASRGVGWKWLRAHRCPAHARRLCLQEFLLVLLFSPASNYTTTETWCVCNYTILLPVGLSLKQVRQWSSVCMNQFSASMFSVKVEH